MNAGSSASNAAQRPPAGDAEDSRVPPQRAPGGLESPSPTGLAGAAPSRAAPSRASPSHLRVWIFAFALAALLYWLTAARDVQWQDSGEFQLRVLRHEVTHRVGLVLAHPLHHWLCRAVAATGLEPADAVTLVSVIASAGLIANIVLLLRLLRVNGLAILFSASALALAHTVWMHATVAEVYGLVGLTLSAELAALAAYFTTRRPGWLVLVALFNGLGVANHLLCGLLTPLHAVFASWMLLRVHRRPGLLGLAVLAWVAGSLPYTVLVALEAQAGGWAAALASASTGGYERQLGNLRLSGRMLARAAGYLMYNFPNFAIPLAALSLTDRGIPKGLYRLIVIDLCVLLIFAMRYDVPDQFVFFYPSYPLLAVLAAFGLDGLMRTRAAATDAPGFRVANRPARLRGDKAGWLAAAAIGSAAVTPLLYYATYHIATARDFLAAPAGNKPYRDGRATFLLPWNHTKQHAQQLRAALDQQAGAQGLVLCADGMLEAALRYDAERDHATGWDVITVPDDAEAPADVASLIQKAAGAGRPVVLVPRNRDRPPVVIPGAVWDRRGDIYVLKQVGGL